jgi:hypothetical protein
VSRADWPLVPLVTVAALPASYLLSMLLVPRPSTRLVLTVGVEAVVALLVIGFVAIDGIERLHLGPERLWDVALWFAVFSAIDGAALLAAGEGVPILDGGTVGTPVQATVWVAVAILAHLVASATVRRYPLDRVRRAEEREDGSADRPGPHPVRKE